MDEYELLVKSGNIGIYNSCEVTELVIMEPNELFIIYILSAFSKKKMSVLKNINMTDSVRR